MTQGKFHELRIEDVELDMGNPRIAKYLEMYDKNKLTSEQISLALGAGDDSIGNQTNYSSLYNSIKTNKGIIHPIIVNHTTEGKYVVIEGNTRVQIYKEFKEYGVDGDWDTIMSIVYENLSEIEIHSIRLQSHLVGPRDWDPYSKAKYLNYLSNEAKLPMGQIVDYCGGKSSEVTKLINAYNDMEKYYRPALESDDEFDQRDFSKFYELGNGRIKTELLKKFTMEDFARWVINGNIVAATDVRRLPEILKDDEATKVLVNSTIKAAYEVVIKNKPEYKDISSVSIEQLCSEIRSRLANMTYQDYMSLKNGDNDTKTNLMELNDYLDGYVKEIIGD